MPAPPASSLPAAIPPRLRLLTAPALLGPSEHPFAPERRYHLAVVLALSPDGLTRDQAAALFWPDRAQGVARSNLRKLILELRRVDLPFIRLDGDRLAWPVDSDATDLLQGRGPAGPWSEPLPGLGGHDSVALDEWLLHQRHRLYEAWQARQRILACADDALQARVAAEALLDEMPDDAEVQRLAARARRALGADGAPHPPAGRRRDDVVGEEPGLVGRGAELAELQALLRERRCRLVTLLGPGGVGKSALALALLQLSATLEVDGVHWVALEDLRQTSQVLPRMARELGVVLGPRSEGWDECLAALRGQQVLLILDNAEHLPDLPALLQRLDGALQDLRVLVTSRHRLGLAHEWVMPLAPLQAAAAQRLFIAAARRAPARIPVDPADPAVEALAEWVGRLPLALRLAAAWTRHLPPGTLLEQLRQSADLLQASESVDEHPAHHSLRACFEHSWELLDPTLRRALAAIAVGPGSLRMDVALATANASSAELAALADASLVDLDPSGRVALHPMLRGFAFGRASEAEVRDALARHAGAISTLMRPYREFDDIDSADALRTIGPELDNLELAWRTALAHHRADWLHDLAPPLAGYYGAHGGIIRVLPQFQQAEALLVAEGPGVASALARVALEHGSLSYWLADYPCVERSMRAALRAARSARLPRAQRQALNGLALAAMRRGRTAEGARWLGHALAQARRLGAEREVGVFAGNLCGVVRELGQLDRAWALAQEALALHRRHGHTVAEVSVLNELALIAHQLDRLDEAFEWSAQALRLMDGQAMALRRPVNLTHQASVRLDQGRLDEARALAEASLSEVNRVGARGHSPTLYRVLAEIAVAQGRRAQAAAYLRSALAVVPPHERGTAARGVLWSCVTFGEAHAEPGVLWLLIHRAELDRPPDVQPLPRYARLRQRLSPDPQSLEHARAAAEIQPGALHDLMERLLG